MHIKNSCSVQGEFYFKIPDDDVSELKTDTLKKSIKNYSKKQQWIKIKKKNWSDLIQKDKGGFI